MTNSPLANWNGSTMPLSEVRVPVLDRAFMFGDAVYEVIRIYHGRLFREEDHLSRLTKSLDSLHINGVEIELIRRRLHETLANTTVSEGLAYIQVTRGEAPSRMHRFPDMLNPNVLVYVDQFEDPYATERLTGVKAVTYPDIRWERNDIKATSLIANCMAAQYAAEHKCAEVIMYDRDGFVTEGSHTSVFAVKDGVVIITPDTNNVLPGVTKSRVIEIASNAGIELDVRLFSSQGIFEMEELFLTGTPEEIVPIVSVDNKPIGTGHRGPIVAALQESFEKMIERWLEESQIQSL